MKPEIKTLWTTALRSGEYRQGKNVLKQSWDEKDTPQHCCLGVLCEIAVKNGLTLETVTNPYVSDDYRTVWDFDGADEVLPPAVMEWAGMDENNPTIEIGDSDYQDIAGLNDSDYTFEQLADIIEKQL